MTSRIKALTVVLEQDVREDDVVTLMTAIEKFRGVLKVTGEVANVADHVAETRIKSELAEKLWSVLNDE